KPTAFSQVFEQVFRVGIGLFLGYTLYKGLTTFGLIDQFDAGVKGAAGAAFGGTVGSIAGLLVILVIYIVGKPMITARRRKYDGGERSPWKQILKEILSIAIPITIGAAIMPIMNFIEAPIIMNRLLASGYSGAEATNLYGQIGGLAMPIINLPQVLTMALAMSLVPLISSAHKERDHEKLQYNTVLSVRIAMLIGLPCAIGIAVLAEPIMLLLYKSRFEEAVNVAPTLALLAVGVIFLSVVQTVSGVLQGVGKQMIPVLNLVVGIVIKIAVTWILVGIPALNIKGAAIGTIAAYIVVAYLDLRATKKYTGAVFDLKLTFLRPAAAALIMGAVAWLIYHVIFGGVQGNSIGTLVSIAVAGVVYLVLLFVLKAITREDLVNMPKGDKIIKLMDKLGRK
ncbi:MAG: polysaccharide biosynthesis C-terminal domain-containing protein, partial [Anaerovoracaceae bacterium]